MDQADPLKDAWAVHRAVLSDADADADADAAAGDPRPHRGVPYPRRRATRRVTQEELDELPFQIAAYCGAPAGVAARRGLAETEEARDAARRAASDGARGGD